MPGSALHDAIQLLNAPAAAIPIDAIDMPVFLVDYREDGKFVFTQVNKAHDIVSGLNSSEFIGKSPEDFLPPRMAKQLNSNYLKCVEKRDRYSYEEHLEMPNGEIWAKTTLTPVLDRDGNVRSLIGIATDITEQKRKYIDTLSKHADVHHMLDKFTNNYSLAAHDLRSPLCQLDTLLQLMELNFTDMGDGKLELITTSKQLIGTSIKMLDEILRRYKRDLDEEPNMRQFSFGHLCGDILSMLDPLALHNITRDDQEVCADPTIVQIILRNLIDNSLKHNKDKTLDLSVRVRASSIGMLQISVTDNGKGFDDNKALISLDASMSDGKEKPGGFGLTGAKKMANACGGDVWVDSKDGLTTVNFSVPGMIIEHEHLGSSQEPCVRVA